MARCTKKTCRRWLTACKMGTVIATQPGRFWKPWTRQRRWWCIPMEMASTHPTTWQPKKFSTFHHQCRVLYGAQAHTRFHAPILPLAALESSIGPWAVWVWTVNGKVFAEFRNVNYFFIVFFSLRIETGNVSGRQMKVPDNSARNNRNELNFGLIRNAIKALFPKAKVFVYGSQNYGLADDRSDLNAYIDLGA